MYIQIVNSVLVTKYLRVTKTQLARYCLISYDDLSLSKEFKVLKSSDLANILNRSSVGLKEEDIVTSLHNNCVFTFKKRLQTVIIYTQTT